MQILLFLTFVELWASKQRPNQNLKPLHEIEFLYNWFLDKDEYFYLVDQLNFNSNVSRISKFKLLSKTLAFFLIDHFATAILLFL